MAVFIPPLIFIVLNFFCSPPPSEALPSPHRSTLHTHTFCTGESPLHTAMLANPLHKLPTNTPKTHHIDGGSGSLETASVSLSFPPALALCLSIVRYSKTVLPSPSALLSLTLIPYPSLSRPSLSLSLHVCPRPDLSLIHSHGYYEQEERVESYLLSLFSVCHWLTATSRDIFLFQQTNPKKL